MLLNLTMYLSKHFKVVSKFCPKYITEVFLTLDQDIISKKEEKVFYRSSGSCAEHYNKLFKDTAKSASRLCSGFFILKFELN